MYYPPKPIEEYCHGEFGGPGGVYRTAPALWNLAWLTLPNVECVPSTWALHPMQDDLASHMWPELYTAANQDYPLVTARLLLNAQDHAICANWLPSTPGTLMERARNAEARLREGQVSDNVVSVDFIMRRKA